MIGSRVGVKKTFYILFLSSLLLDLVGISFSTRLTTVGFQLSQFQLCCCVVVPVAMV